MRLGGMVLVELLVVAALILVLFTLYFSGGSRHYQRRQKEACRENLRFIYLALQMYAADWEGSHPLDQKARTSEPVLSLLVPKYSVRTDVFICPGSPDRKLPEAKPFPDRRASYAYLMGLAPPTQTEQWLLSDEQVNTQAKAVGEPLFAGENGTGPGSNHRQYGGSLLFMDGRTESSPQLAAVPITVPSNAVMLNPRP
jgi:type II secretory pathway pseudopilin PulG